MRKLPDLRNRIPIFCLGFRQPLRKLDGMDSADAMRRWLGAFCLAVAFGLLVWGETLLKPMLTGILFLFYWLGCFAFTFGAIIFALLDVRAVRRRTRAERRELIERTFHDLEKKSDPAKH